MLAIIVIIPISPREVNPWGGAVGCESGLFKHHDHTQQADSEEFVIWGYRWCYLF